jgi:SAM-dependent methyltransferase
MKVFDAYGLYYDLLYRDKDYQGEANYVHSLVQSHSPGAQSILELGSGTGVHACLLAEKGYSVTGVDQSESMLRIAEKRKQASTPTLAGKIDFAQGDIRKFENGKTYDAVISLFHVMSYMRSNSDVLDAFYTADRHLKKGGIFLFDCWYGPGVRHDRPVKRVKHFSDDHSEVRRTANPVMHTDANLVDVNFDIEVKNKLTGESGLLQETHTMHYLFTEEITEYCKWVNFELLLAEEWLTRKPLQETSWNACYICKKS